MSREAGAGQSAGGEEVGARLTKKVKPREGGGGEERWWLGPAPLELKSTPRSTGPRLRAQRHPNPDLSLPETSAVVRSASPQV